MFLKVCSNTAVASSALHSEPLSATFCGIRRRSRQWRQRCVPASISTDRSLNMASRPAIALRTMSDLARSLQVEWPTSEASLCRALWFDPRLCAIVIKSMCRYPDSALPSALATSLDTAWKPHWKPSTAARHSFGNHRGNRRWCGRAAMWPRRPYWTAARTVAGGNGGQQRPPLSCW